MECLELLLLSHIDKLTPILLVFKPKYRKFTLTKKLLISILSAHLNLYLEVKYRTIHMSSNIKSKD